MFKFDNRHIFTGYIKQLLASTNLPQYKIYTKENELYLEKYGEESPEIIKTIKYGDNTYNNSEAGTVIRYTQYIKNGMIQEYISDDNGKSYHWEPCKITTVFPVANTESEEKYSQAEYGKRTRVPHNHTYFPDKFELNYTTMFKIKNNIYDTETHEYLGEYLRFQRDYYNINLMGLYNCFSNRIVNNINISTATNTINKQLIDFNGTSPSYKIYMLPVKFFKKYTIAIDSDLPVEMCCCIYQKYTDTVNRANTLLIQSTYKKFNFLKFDSPELYTALTIDEFGKDLTDNIANNPEDTWKNELIQNEKNLKLLVKVPAGNKSSIVILEGDFKTNNNRIYDHDLATGKWLKLTNRVVTNYEIVEDGENARTIEDICNMFKPLTPLQLLQMNSGISYPFADTLIEYLSGNAITSEETIPNNIRYVQKILQLNKYKIALDGNWSPEIQPMIYDYLTTKELKNFGPEVLGYVDKNAEMNVKYVDQITGKSIAISGVNLEDLEDSSWLKKLVKGVK